ncbi:hypothetical protein B0H11DRAFT_34572 [Mycena galericulata]|nr:hypothetical protein B0H11DRAFT_34572 [Mycena galericulata]
MDSCPNEILADIVQYLPESDLLNVRLVGRRFKDVATRPAFSKLVVCDNMPSVQRFHKLLTESEDDRILHGVEAVKFDGTITEHFSIGADSTLDLLEKSFSLLHRLPSLHSLRLEFFPDSTPDSTPDPNEISFSTYYVEVQLAIWSGLGAVPLPGGLRSLYIGEMVTYFPERLETEAFLDVFRPLTSLSISVVSLYQAGRIPAEILNFPNSLTLMLLMAQNLTSLELSANALAGRTSPFAFGALRFPALTSLRLQTIVFAGQHDDQAIPTGEGQPLAAETFILHHKTTLRRLELRDCAVRDPEGAWHHVLHRLRIHLSKLVEFIWTVNSLQPGENFLYGHPVGPLGMYTVIDDDLLFISDDPQDVAALEELKSVVLLRKNNEAS